MSRLSIRGLPGSARPPCAGEPGALVGSPLPFENYCPDLGGGGIPVASDASRAFDHVCVPAALKIARFAGVALWRDGLGGTGAMNRTLLCFCWLLDGILSKILREFKPLG